MKKLVLIILFVLPSITSISQGNKVNDFIICSYDYLLPDSLQDNYRKSKYEYSDFCLTSHMDKQLDLLKINPDSIFRFDCLYKEKYLRTINSSNLFDAKQFKNVFSLGINDFKDGDTTLVSEILSMFPNLLILSTDNYNCLPSTVSNIKSIDIFSYKDTLTYIPKYFPDLECLKLEISTDSYIEDNFLNGFEDILNLYVEDIYGLGLIETLPNSLSNLKKLKAIRINLPSLKKLPDNIGNLENLQYMQIEDWQVQELPKSFSKLNNLVYLYVDKPLSLTYHDVHKKFWFEKFPNELSELKNLKTLMFYIAKNDLKNIPEYVKTMTGLETLFVSGKKMRCKKVKDSKKQKTKIENRVKEYLPNIKEVGISK